MYKDFTQVVDTINSMNEVFDKDPDQEENTTFPDPELEQDDVEITTDVGSAASPDSEEPLDMEALFQRPAELEAQSVEFNKDIQDTTTRWDLDPNSWANIKLQNLYNRETGLYNVANFLNDEARTHAIAFNNVIEKQKAKYQEALEPWTRVANPGEETTFEGYGGLYKFEFDKDGYVKYYYRDSVNDKWEEQENDSNKYIIQTLFGQNKSTKEDLDEHILRTQLFEFNKQLHNIDVANKNAIQAIEDGLMAPTNLDQYLDEDTATQSLLFEFNPCHTLKRYL